MTKLLIEVNVEGVDGGSGSGPEGQSAETMARCLGLSTDCEYQITNEAQDQVLGEFVVSSVVAEWAEEDNA